MSTLAEIEMAVDSLPIREQRSLLGFLADRVGTAASRDAKKRRSLKALKKPALEGLPSRLSTGTREKVKSMVARSHAANR